MASAENNEEYTIKIDTGANGDGKKHLTLPFSISRQYHNHIFEYETSALIAAGVIIYFSGFFIVNAYLSRFHLADIETVNLGIFQPAYITAGFMYLLISLVSFVLSLHPAYSIYEDLRRRYRSKITGTAWILPLLKNAMPIFIWDAIGIFFISSILAFSIRSITSDVFVALLKSVAVVIILQSIFASLPFVCVFLLRKKIKDSVIVVISALFVMLFLFVHSYTLLITADKIYERLPVIVGGGQERVVIFFVTPDQASHLALIDDNMTKKIIDIPISGSGTLLQTNELILYWQFSSANISQNETGALYFIRPKGCDDCPIIQIPKQAVYGVIYVEPPINPVDN